MKRRTLTVIIIAVAVALAALWAWRYIAVNKYYNEKYAVPEVIYGIGDEIELGDNVIEMELTADGYELTFDSCELLEYDDALEKYGISQVEADEFYYAPERVAVVSLTVHNENNADAEIPIYDLTLCGTDWYTDMNDALTAAMNGDGWDTDYSCGIGETEQIYLVYNLRESRFPKNRWATLSDEPLTMTLTWRPEKIKVRLQ